ncbi:MAG: hypothetical protein KGI38_10070 [Thaumarchaeota archaeon]|nr:hypothetical protein [Nitrososphaerota archaeon]
MIDSAAKSAINAFYWLSPYRWIDEWQKKLEARIRDEGGDWERIRRRRYRIDELYIVGWLGLAIVLLPIAWVLPTAFFILPLARAAGIVNKELGVVLFGICKISEGDKVSATPRVILLALVNYLTAGLLFALAYARVGTYQLDSAVIASPLPPSYAAVEGLSVLFTLSPAYTPLDLMTRILTMGESAFCFLFGILIISTFVNLIHLKSAPVE